MTPEQRLDLAHTLMLTSFVAFLFATMGAYVWVSDENLIVQVFSHLAMLLIPVVFKIAYVLRLHALKSLGLAAH